MKNENDNPKQKNKSFFVRNVWLSPVYYVYFLSALTALGILYVNRENMVNRNSIRPDLAIDSTFFRPISNMPPGPATSGGGKIDLATLLQPTKAQIEHGEQLFKMDCAPCHGVDGRGDGPAAASLNPKPRNFHATTGWVNGRLLSEMFKTVSEGVPGSAMVSFAGALSASDRLSIIDYIRSTFGNFPKDTPQQLEQMNQTFHLEKVSAPTIHISITDAVKEIEEGALPRGREAEAALAYVRQHNAEDGAQILNRVAIDRERALTMLAASNTWSKSLNSFVMTVTSDAVQNGFDPKVAQLNDQQWQALFGYLKGVFNATQATSTNG